MTKEENQRFNKAQKKIRHVCMQMIYEKFESFEPKSSGI